MYLSPFKKIYGYPVVPIWIVEKTRISPFNSLWIFVQKSVDYICVGIFQDSILFHLVTNLSFHLYHNVLITAIYSKSYYYFWSLLCHLEACLFFLLFVYLLIFG